ncbi:sugar lactone lactonase YvrE [Granulicella aggregans]|uniref:Sugar lactone lactonase YvrE n=1 Tax=Granulicella aggregans TaxID=474949 RepID=A0A7W8E3K1_9BACT|nr:sugar lactone lactonase YvrE [Granulicella aggregans]
MAASVLTGVFSLMTGHGQAIAQTATTLAVTSGGSSVTTVASGTAVSLTASVHLGSAAVKAGQVNFCDATAKFCTDVHIVGTGHLTSGGTATVTLRPSIGNHSYKAVFTGTNGYAGSSSSTSALKVTGATSQGASATTIAESGSFGNYSLTATVTGTGSTTPLAGNVSLLDTSKANAVLAAPSLGASVAGIAWPASVAITADRTSRAVSLADFNGDGIPDIASVIGGPEAPLLIYLGKADGTYTQVASYPAITGYSIGPIVLGDFNGDGKLDMAVPDGDYNATQIFVLLGNGDGTFVKAATSPQLSSAPTQLAVGDFNGDGVDDLAVVAYGSNTINVFLGNGDGTFTAAASSPSTTSQPNVVVAADFNGDGKVDLAYTDSYDDFITVLSGNGDGSFTGTSPFHCGSSGSPLVTADFNGDGKLDLAVAIAATNTTGQSLTVLTGNGDATFTAPQLGQAAGANSVLQLLVGDFNADGLADVTSIGTTPSSVTVYLGDGKGGFSSTSLQVPSNNTYVALPIAVADVNGDGRTDILAGNAGPDSMAVYATQPTETATASSTVILPTAGMHLVDASYAGDTDYGASVSATTVLLGVPPVTKTALTIIAGGSAVSSVANGTAVTLTATVTAGGSPVTSGQVKFCDASASECTDIHLLATSLLSSGGSASYKFVPGSGTHSYKAILVEAAFGISSTSGTATLTVGAGKSPVYSDLVTVSVGGTSVGTYTLTGTVVGFGGPAAPTGDVSFIDTSFSNAVLGTAALGSATAGTGWQVSAAGPATQSFLRHEVTGDFNSDGIPDLAVLSVDQYGENATISIYRGLGDGTFAIGTPVSLPYASGGYSTMLAGDFNADGNVDLAVLSFDFNTTSSEVTTFLGNGHGIFTTPQTSVVFNEGNVGGDFIQPAMVAEDFNGDGKLDLAVVGNDVVGGLSVILGNGDGTFTTTGVLNLADRTLGSIATGDFNGDGIPDLVAGDYFGSGQGTVLLGKGDGKFVAAPGSLPFPSFSQSIVVGDFNGDGVLDLASGFTGAVEIYLGKGDGTFTAAPGSPASVSGSGLVVGDFNQDGKLDLASADQYENRVQLLVGVGDGTFSVTTPALSDQTIAPTALVVTDFNGDGVPDLAALNGGPAITSILLTEKTETASAQFTGQGPVGAGVHAVEAKYAGDSNYPTGTSAPTQVYPGLVPLVITPAGGTYTSAQTLTISEAIPGATIMYYLSGAISTNGYVPYTGPIALNQGGTEYLTAYAEESGYNGTNGVSAIYALSLPVAPAPTLSPAPGSYSGTQMVTISDTVAGATLYYTTNGTVPTIASPVYSGPIAVSSSETLTVYAAAAGYTPSATTSGEYLISSTASSYVYRAAGTLFTGYSGDEGPAPLAQLNFSLSTTLDAAGNLYIADSQNNVIRKVTTDTKVITTIAGTGIAGFSGDGGAATSAQLSFPYGLATDISGNLYFADNGNNVVRRIDARSGVITTIAGNGAQQASGDGGPATSAGVPFPTAVALDGLGNIFIATPSSDTIRKIDAKTGTISTYAGGGAGISGDGGPATATTLSDPEGIALDGAGNLYIAEMYNNDIRKVTVATGVISTVAGQPVVNGQNHAGFSGDNGPASSALLNEPEGMTVDSSGNLYFADSYNLRVRKIASATGIITTVAGNGDQNCNPQSGDGGPALSSSFCYPRSVTVDTAGNLYVTDYSRVSFVTAPGAPPTAATSAPAFTLAAGSYAGPQTLTISDTAVGAEIYVTLDGTEPTALSAAYQGPVTITGSVTVKAIALAPGMLPSSSTSAGYTILSPPTAVLKTIAGNGKYGFSGQDGPAASATLGDLEALALDSAGNIYFSDIGNEVVWRISASTGTISVVAGSGTPGRNGDGGAATSAQLYYPQGLAINAAGDLFIADSFNNVVRKVSATTGIITTVAGSGTFSYPPLIGDGGPATMAQLSEPLSLALDGAGNLYITDFSANRVRMVAAATGIITTVAGTGDNIDKGDGGLATNASIQYPTALTIDKTGNLFFASAQGGSIRRVDAVTKKISTLGGNKNLGNSGDGGVALAAEVRAEALAVDAAGNIYFSNVPGSIRKIDPTTGIISRVAGSGYPGVVADGTSATLASLSQPYGIAFDSSGNLYIAEYNGFRVRELTFPGAAAAPVFSPGAGTYTGTQNVTLTDSTPGAAIYYTLDGSTPSPASTAYTGAISLTSSATIRAIAVAAGFSESPVASATFTINQPVIDPPVLGTLSPAFVSAGSSAFVLTVSGSAFTSSSVVLWGSTSLPTQFISATQLTASVPASDVAIAGTANVTVQTPGAGGGTSNALAFEIDSAGSGGAATFSPTTATVTAGATATYPVTLPASATNVTATCLNLPSGGICSYSASTKSLTISTASTTPKGTYQITVVFTETLPGAAAGSLLPLLLLLPVRRGKRRVSRGSLVVITIVLASAAFFTIGCSSGGGGGTTTPPPQTHQATSSAIVTLTVQ